MLYVGAMDLKPRQRSIKVRGRVIASPLSAKHYVIGTSVVAAVITVYFVASVLFHSRIVCYHGMCTQLTKAQVNFQSLWWGIALVSVLIMLCRNIYLMRLAEVEDAAG